MSFSAYEHYKDSGIEWIKDIPIDWETHRIKDFLSFKIGGTPSTSIESYFEGDNIWVSIADLSSYVGDYIFDSSVKISDDAIKVSNVKKISKDSLLYSFKLSVGLTAFAGCELYTNEAIASFEQNNYVDLNFLKYVFQVGFENNATENIYGAKLFNTDLIKFARFVMPVDKEEQIKIATFLDNKTLKINENIAKNKQLISLLEEKKSALINQVVTKGLDPNVPMKDSGIEWIGEIPEHWNIVKIKFCTNIINEKKDFADSNDKYVGLEHIQSKTGKLLGFSREGAEGNVNKFKENMVLLGKLRPYLAKVILTTFEGVCSTEILVFFAKNQILANFLYYLFLSKKFIEQINSSTYGVKMPRASPDFIKNTFIVIPPLSDQEEIISFLNEETFKIDKSIEKIQENIDLLEEYKDSLIYHVVTGKIDVRDEI